jgi:periodic tryptophan protein 2
MKFSYRLSKICGNVFENGNLIFTPDGNSVISPIGNRITIFDLVQHSTTTLPFENKKSIARIELSHNGRFLITVDVDGHALFINFPRRVVLTRFHFKRKVFDIKFAPNDECFAVTFGHGCQIWRTPGIKREFSPLVLSRTVSGHHDDTTCLAWSSDSQSLVLGSKDLSARVYYRAHSKNMSMSMLVGHRSELIGVHYYKDDDQIFTVGADGAVFTWQFDYADRIVVDEDSSSEESDEESSDDENKKGGKVVAKRPNTLRGGEWKLKDRTFLWDQHTEVVSTAYNKANSLLVVGFHNGVFGLYDMPGCVNIHKLSVSHNSLNTVNINSTGEWLVIGSKALGQMLVWEWQSESYVIKQQGHMYGLNAMDFSGDGLHIATGGDDAKVKLWNVASGFCFVTFSEHLAPVTGVKFVGKGAGKSVISASLDGTVRAHDLLRYQNFRTLTTPTPVQFTSLAVDSSGEMVCAGTLDPFEVFVWSLQTGSLLDVLSGHEGPIACLSFAQNSGRLASGSWDGTLKLWDIYKNECTETFEHGCDVLAVAFRPDGLEVCTTATNGNIYFWDVVNGSQISMIEGRRDIRYS